MQGCYLSQFCARLGTRSISSQRSGASLTAFALLAERRKPSGECRNQCSETGGLAPCYNKDTIHREGHWTPAA